MDYVDNIRTILLFCVVAAHALIPYQYDTKLWYLDAPEQLGAATEIFFEVCVTFVMPAFFFISGFFSLCSLRRKGAVIFIRERLRRLGLPLAFMIFTILPLILYVRHLHFRDDPVIFSRYYLNYFLGISGPPTDWSELRWPDLQIAHLWYIENLLIMSAVLSIVYSAFGPKCRSKPRPMPPPGILMISAYAILIGTVLWIQRQHWPAQHWFALFGFIQTSTTNLVICPPMFLFGVLAAYYGWLQRTRLLTGWIALAAGGALIILRGFIAAFGIEFDPLMNTSLARCLWEAVVGTSLIVAAFALGPRWLDISFPASRAVARAGYGIYLFHLPVVVAMQWALLAAPLSGLLKMSLALLVGIAAPYVITTALLVKSSHMRRIL